LSFKIKTHLIRITLLSVMIFTVGAAAFGCVSGGVPIGWSGGTASDNTIYVASREGRLVSLNTADDSRRWSEQIKMTAQTGFLGCSPSTLGCGGGSTNVAIYGKPLIYNGLVYIAGYNGKVYAFTSGNLTERWVFPREGNLQPFVSGLVNEGGRLYIGCADGKVYALDAATGDKLWEYATGEKIWATPALSGGTLYIGSFDKKLYAINTADGTKKWEFKTEGAIMSTPLIYQNTVYFGSMDRNFYAINDANADVKWKIKAENWFWAEPVIVNNAIYAGSLDGNVYVIKADTGEKLTVLNLNGQVASNPVIVDSSVIFATRKGVIFSVNTVNNQATQLMDLKLEVDGPLSANAGIIYLQTLNTALQRINAASGSLLSPVSLVKPK
jgi:eukaryotic-like serine/threonine-protein kinase